MTAALHSPTCQSALGDTLPSLLRIQPQAVFCKIHRTALSVVHSHISTPTAEADKRNAFDLDRLINRRRRPGLSEVCEVYQVDVPDDALTDEDEDILNCDDIDDPDAF